MRKLLTFLLLICGLNAQIVVQGPFITVPITTVGALNSGSITSGFGSIDVGADSITGGAISGTTVLATNNGATMPGSFPSASTRMGSSYDGQNVFAQLAYGATNTANIQGLAGGTRASPTATPTASNIAIWGGLGYDTTTGWGNGSGTTTARINFISTDAFTSTAQGSKITFDVTPTGSTVASRLEVASLTSTGLAVTGVAQNTYSGATGNYIQNSSDTSGTSFVQFNKSAGTAIGSVTRVTTTDAVAYNTTSDGRLKTNIRDFTAADSGRIIDGLQPRWFDWKLSDLTESVEEIVDTGKLDEKGEPIMEKQAKQRKVTDSARVAKHITDNQSHVGFVAQEEAAVDPLLARIGAVTVGDDDPDNISKQWQRSDSALVPIIIAELKAVRQRETVKDAQIADLMTRVVALEAKP